jgi:uncharacterized protein (DUF2126 family)
MMITDPGVISECASCKKTWQEIVDNTSALYDVLCRLGTDKFMVDGRHTELVAETM